MEPPLSSFSIFFLLLLFLISVNIPTSLGADDVRFTNCRSNSFSCGSISNLKYPFWGGNRADYCGRSDFQLSCEDNIPRIYIQSIKYRILNLDWNSEALTVARDDYYDTICPRYYENSTLDPTTFYYDSGGKLVNVTFLYNCSDTTSFQSNVFGQNCRRDDGIYTTVYYALGSVYLDSCTSVVMPVSLAGDAIAVIPNHIQSALDDGFELRWIVNNNECDTCSNSGGECGYNSTEGHFSCFCKEGPRSPYCLESKKLGWRLKIAIGVSASVAGVAVIFILIFCNWKMRFRNKKWNILEGTGVYYHHNLKTFIKDNGSLAPRQYSFSEVKKMTKSFSNKLGEGGYGIVYKARLPDGRPVAVKVIRDSIGSGEEFINEVVSISRTSHVNIVTLLGFCFERNKRVLIYEYMPNGSLDNFIHKIESPTAFSTLTPKGLYQITIGIARGLEYLHRGCNTRILHFDIKPQNILLDENFCPKISDFGLAKICQKRESIVSIFGARGTIGFIAPEVFSRAYGGVSHKSDVYSYGMLILEMIGGRKNYNSGGSHTSEMYFPDWIYKDLEQGTTSSSSLSISEEENEVMRKITLVSLWCIQINPSDRPAMSNVVEMLEGPLQSLPFPPKPYLHCPPPRSPLLFSNASSDDMLETNSTSTSNNASIV